MAARLALAVLPGRPVGVVAMKRRACGGRENDVKLGGTCRSEQAGDSRSEWDCGAFSVGSLSRDGERRKEQIVSTPAGRASETRSKR